MSNFSSSHVLCVVVGWLLRYSHVENAKTVHSLLKTVLPNVTIHHSDLPMEEAYKGRSVMQQESPGFSQPRKCEKIHSCSENLRVLNKIA